MSELAIKVDKVSKMYKLYNSKRDRLKDTFGNSKKANFKEHYALNDMSFEVAKGECVGIIGTNGAGKSTILKIITGVLSPTSGEVKINGRISALLELGAGFNMEYTGLENVYLNGTMIGFTREEIDAKLDDILAFADIGDFINQPVKMYSSGMFVRLAFAVAISIDPEILIVDEALSVGDVFFQAKCYKKFEDFKKQGKTILFVSHDLSSINKYCDRVVLLNKGRMLDEGSPKTMIDLYKKVLVGQADKEKEESAIKTSISEMLDENATDSVEGWKANFRLNPEINEYGDNKAEIIDFAVVDEDGNLSSTIMKGSRFVLKSKVRFNEDVTNPIFTFTFKNIKGVDVTGTNTMYEKVFVEKAFAGEVYVASFEQEMNLQGGDYLLSMSCTGYDNDGNFAVHHRLYDFLNVTVVSDKNTVGFYDMNSVVKVEKVEE